MHIPTDLWRLFSLVFVALVIVSGDTKPYVATSWPGSAPKIEQFPPEDDHVSGRSVSDGMANLPAEELIIGVSSGTRHRAYPIRKFWSGCHVVNDIIAGEPVTVTYCGLTHCSRVFAGKGLKELDIRSAGYLGGLLISTSGQSYWQKTLEPWDTKTTTPFPYESIGYEVTTWGNWRASHPDTDVAAP